MAGPDELELDFDPNNVALGDLEDLETHWGLTFQQLMRAADGKAVEALGAKVLSAMAFLVLRQSNPDATPEQARRMKLPELVAVLRTMQGPAGEAPAQRLAGGARGGGAQDPPAGS